MLTDRPLYARQPILNAQMEPAAYELLFRGDLVSGEAATCDVLLAALDQNVFDAASTDLPVFVNFPSQILFDTPMFDPNKLVIEVLEDVTVTPELIDRLKHLRSLGFRIALDDFELSPENAPLLEVADIVKVDVLAVDDLSKEICQLRDKVPQLLAEKVEDHDTYQLCQDLGVDLFQGYFFSRPQLVSGKTAVSNAGTVMRLLAALQDENMTAARLEEIILEDTTLTYRVLKLVNSAAFRRSNEVTSVSNAVTVLGMRQITAFVSLFVLGQSEDKSSELLAYTAMRGALCREMGELIDSAVGADACFTLGVLSCCDAHFDTPMAELAEGLPIHKDMHAALVERAGVLGGLLDLAQLYQEGRWRQVREEEINALSLSREQVDEAYQTAQAWTDQHLSQLAS